MDLSVWQLRGHEAPQGEPSYREGGYDPVIPRDYQVTTLRVTREAQWWPTVAAIPGGKSVEQPRPGQQQPILPRVSRITAMRRS